MPRRTNRINAILNSFGWKITNGHAEYRGFEHTLNLDILDWRANEREDEEIIVIPEPEPEPKPVFHPKPHARKLISKPVELDPQVLISQKRNQELHDKLIEAQKRVDTLKTKVKDQKGTNA